MRNAGTAISSIYEDTVRALVGPGQSNPSIEDNDGLTCYDLIRTEYMGGSTALLTWLLRATAYDFDPDHRDNLGRTLLMRLAGSSVASSTVDALCSLGADVNARVTETEQADPRTVGMTALHFAASRLTKREETISTMKKLLIRVAHPHTTSDAGETPTDIILRAGGHMRFLAWYTILSELDFDIKEFARAEIEAHADVPWFTANRCDEYLLAHFGLEKKFDDGSGLTSYQSPSNDEPDGSEDDTEVISYDDLADELSLFSDSDTDVEESPTSEYHSAEEDISSSQDLSIDRLATTSFIMWQKMFRRIINPRKSRRHAAGWKAYRLFLKDPKTEGRENGDMQHWQDYLWECTIVWGRWNRQHDSLQCVLYHTRTSL